MKYTRSDAINQNIKRNHTKKYQHNMNIITFLKSNYKYKRRCTNERCLGNSRRMQQKLLLVRRQQQTQPLPVVDEKMPDHRITQKISLYTTKVSKFPRIFILIMQSVTATATTTPPTTTAMPPPPKTTTAATNDSGGLIRPFVVGRDKRNMITNPAFVAKTSGDSIRRQNNAYKDANEDTNIDSDATNLNGRSRHHHVGDEMHYQHSNYDKVSTITSTPPLRCQRQKHHQTQSTAAIASIATAVATTTATTFPIPPTTSTLLSLPSSSSSSPSSSPSSTTSTTSDQSNYDETGRCFTTTLRHCCYHRNQTNHHAMHTKSSASVRCNKGMNTSRSATRSCQSVDQYINTVVGNRSNTLSLLLTLFVAFAIAVRTAAAGACWQTVLGNGKCNEIYSFNVSKGDCCGANQEFAYTDREPTDVEYFFATAIGGGMECTPCLESCRNVKCGPNKKCVKRKGRPKCICAPECGAARRRRLQREQQHHSLFLEGSEAEPPSEGDLRMTGERSRQSRDTHSLSSEITKVNVGSENQNQRKLIHIHMQQDYAHQQEVVPAPKRKNQQSKGNRRLLITANVEHTEKPTTRRIQLFSNVRTTHARRRNNNSANGQHEDTDLSEDYEEDDYDDEDADDDDDDDGDGAGGHRSRGISFNNGFSNSYSYSNANSNSNSNSNNRNDDATRFLNQSLSRHKHKQANKNNHALHTTKMQQEQYSGNGNNSSIGHPSQNGRHAENASNRHRNNQHHQHQQHPHRQHQHQHHNHHHHRHRDRHDQRPQHHHNSRQPNQNSGRRKHNKQRPNLQKTPKNHKDYNTTSVANVATATSSTIANTVSQSTYKAPILNLSPSSSSTSLPSSTSLSSSSSPPPPSSYFTNPQQQLLLPPTTPVKNSTMSAAGALDQSRLPNHGSKITTSSSLPSSIPPPSPSSSSSSSSSSSALSGSGSPTHAYTQSAYASMPAAAASTSFPSSSASSFSSISFMQNAKGEGVSSHQSHHRDRSGKLKTTPVLSAAAAAATTTTDSYNDNDNTISTLHSNSNSHQNAVSYDSFFDQFDLHGFPKSQHPITITDSIRTTNPVCGTDGRTYNTECQLRKRACRTDNPNLQVAYRGHCKTTCNGVKCLEGLTCVEDQYTMPHCIACKIECPLDDYDNDNDVVDATRAVCGADGKTYKSMCDINRIICKIGRSIGVAYPGPCRGNQVSCDDINCGPKQVCLIDLLTHQPRCTPCRYKCSRKRRPSSLRFEEEKICGVNNRTYNSWCEMRKDSCSTGFYIEVKYPGHCH